MSTRGVRNIDIARSVCEFNAAVLKKTTIKSPLATAVMEQVIDWLTKIAGGEDPAWVISGGDPQGHDHRGWGIALRVEAFVSHGAGVNEALRLLAEREESEFEQVKRIYYRWRENVRDHLEDTKATIATMVHSRIVFGDQLEDAIEVIANLLGESSYFVELIYVERADQLHAELSQAGWRPMSPPEIRRYTAEYDADEFWGLKGLRLLEAELEHVRKSTIPLEGQVVSAEAIAETTPLSDKVRDHQGKVEMVINGKPGSRESR